MTESPEENLKAWVSRFGWNCSLFFFGFFWFFVVIKSENSYFASHPGLGLNPWEYVLPTFLTKVVLAVGIQFGEISQPHTIHIVDDECHTGWRRPLGCLIFVGHFPQKNPIISGSSAERTCNPRYSVGLRHPVRQGDSSHWHTETNNGYIRSDHSGSTWKPQCAIDHYRRSHSWGIHLTSLTKESRVVTMSITSLRLPAGSRWHTGL